jgi:hypothetical protein
MAEGVEAVSLAGLFDRVLSARGWRIARGNGPRQHPLRGCALTGAAGTKTGNVFFTNASGFGSFCSISARKPWRRPPKPQALFNRYLD